MQPPDNGPSLDPEVAVDNMTDEHFETFRDAAGEHVGLDREDCRLILRGLMEAGFTLTFPKPRYYIEDDSVAANVRDRRRDGIPVARFILDNHPDARCAAQAECDRLNGRDADLEALARDTLAQWPDEDWCDATIDIGGSPVACSVPEPRDRHAAHQGARDHLTVSWDDDAVGAS